MNPNLQRMVVKARGWRRSALLALVCAAGAVGLTQKSMARPLEFTRAIKDAQEVMQETRDAADAPAQPENGAKAMQFWANSWANWNNWNNWRNWSNWNNWTNWGNAWGSRSY